MNAKMIEALNGIYVSLGEFLEEARNTQGVVSVPSHPSIPVEEIKEVEAVEKAVEVVKDFASDDKTTSRKAREAAEVIPSPEAITEESLNSLSYNNLKKLAKDMGIPAIGSRDDLTAKLLATAVTAVEEVEEVEIEEVKEVEAPKKPSRKLGKKEPEVVEEEEEEEIDPLVAKVNEVVEDMTDEEILDVLVDVGVRAKGKRQSLVAAVIQAVRDGLLDLDDEEEVEEAPQAVEEVTEEVEETEVALDPNDENHPELTPERRAAMEAFIAETTSDFEDDAIDRKEVEAWLDEFHGEKRNYKKVSFEDLVQEYMYCSCLLINDEGEMPEEEGAYLVNGEPYCCGHALKYVEENNTYVCEMCGAEYEAD